MDFANYYQDVYLILVTILTYQWCKKGVNYQNANYKGAIWLCVVLCLVIGFRPIHRAFVDTMGYAEVWQFLVGQPFVFDSHAQNLIFDNLMAWFASAGFSINIFFLCISIIYFFGILLSCRKLFPNDTFLVFLVYLGAFSTYSFGTNGIKAGAAASVFLLALAYRDKLNLSIILALISWGLHHSMQLPIAAYLVTLLFKNHKWYFAGWVICLLISIAHITYFQVLFGGLTDEQGAGYLIGDDEHGTIKGFRYDFVIYSVMPIIMGYCVKYKYKLSDKLYDNLLNMYMTCNGIWLLCMYAAYTNRIAYLSWFMYPILVIYPCYMVNEKNHPLVVNRNKIIAYHLGFTLFMHFIFYGLR